MAKRYKTIVPESLINVLPGWLQAVLRHPVGAFSAFFLGNIALCQLICWVGVRRRAALRARKERRALASASSLAKAMGIDPAASSGYATLAKPTVVDTTASSPSMKPVRAEPMNSISNVIEATPAKDIELIGAESICDATEESCATCRSLADTVKRIDRHVIVSTSGVWEKHVEKHGGTFIYALNGAIEKLQSELGVKIKLKLTACERASSEDGFTDVIMYPERILLQVPTATDTGVQALARVALGLDPASESGLRYEPVPYRKLVLVCTHMARDKRCGKAGPIIVKELRGLLGAQGVAESDVAVFPSSHIGGHEFAGTLIIYPESECFGYITKKKCELLVRRILATSAEDANLLQECLRGAFLPSW